MESVAIKARATNGGEADEYFESVSALIEAIKILMPDEVQITIKGKGSSSQLSISRAFYDSEEDRIKLTRVLQKQVDLAINPELSGGRQ